MNINFDKMRSRAASIMLKHPECFPILKYESEKKGIIFTYIGFDKTVAKVIEFYYKIPILDIDIIPALQTTALQEILFQYFVPTFTNEDDIVKSYTY